MQLTALDKWLSGLDPITEAGRPRDFEQEFLNGDGNTKALGIRIRYTKPSVGYTFNVHRLEPMKIQLVIECIKPIPLRDITAWVYTNIFHMDNFEGTFCEVKLPYDEGSRVWDDQGLTQYTFSTIIYPTQVGEYRMTFNVKTKTQIIWANKYGADAQVIVLVEHKTNRWVQDDRVTPITSVISVANISAIGRSAGFYFKEVDIDDVAHFVGSDAFSAVFSLVGNIEIDMPQDDSFIRLSLEEGGAHEIAPERLELIVNVIRKLTDTTHKGEKALVVDSEGLGCIGSCMVAYIYVNNPAMTFDDAVAFVRRRRQIYCKKGLRETCETMFPRT